MRIVGGSLRRRRLVAPEGQSTRPTSDQARQALFNVLEHAPWSKGLNGARVLDLFAGSGALGLEALSRGAASCQFIDNSRQAVKAIAANIESLDLAGVARLRATDTRAYLNGAPAEPFDLIFLDPPYGRGLAEPALAALTAPGWLAPGALVVVETAAGEALTAPPGLAIVDGRRWGAAEVRFIRQGAPAP